MKNGITYHELDDAKSILLHNMHMLYADNDIGHRFRLDVIEKFKKQRNIKSNDIEVAVIEADLANDIDVKNALKIEMMHEEC